MDLPQEVVERLDTLEESLETLGCFLTPFLEATPREVDASMPPLEAARAHLTLAKAAVLLARLRLRLRGEALGADHPLQREQERIERYEKKLGRASREDELARTRPGSDLNVAAANRFISAAIPDLTPAQKAALRAVGAGGGQQQRRAGGKREGEEGGGGGKRARGGGGGGGSRSGGGSGADAAEADDPLGQILAAAAGGAQGEGDQAGADGAAVAQ
ncbi:hypothetical protein Rsub_01163 [Raphidocelis subcapitata]|uniref:Nuclear nucleic acid-binding protein C1D n=1 Tax=Raphidocelis subcapitata TaxID=307507 RepID=A0A2V0NSA0_9CHLO|nr:hypothetical protein Rsub_01163 [Raphidocelis subcapitata]|eukprot:GBF88450.1 hypothetical protein Rsub_01163 [Raphidocelis subcapitata]